MEFTIRAQVRDFEITSVEPNVVGSVGFVTLEIYGSQFRAGDIFEVVSPSGDGVQAIETNPVSSARAYATLDLTGATPGSWDLRLRRGGVAVTLPQALTVVRGGGPNFFVEVTGRGVIRSGRWNQYTVVFGNSGNADAYGAILTIAGIPNDAEIQLGPEFVPPTFPSGLEWSGPLYTRTETETVLIPLLAPQLRPGKSRTATFMIKVPTPRNFQITPLVLGPITMNTQLYSLFGPSSLLQQSLANSLSVSLHSDSDRSGDADCKVAPEDRAALLQLVAQVAYRWPQGTFIRWFWNQACVGQAQTMLTNYADAAKEPNSLLGGWTFVRITKNGIGVGHTTVMVTSPLTGRSYLVDNYVAPTIIPLQKVGEDRWIIPDACRDSVFGYINPFIWLDGLIMSSGGDMEALPYWKPYHGDTPVICPNPKPKPTTPVEVAGSVDPNIKVGPTGAGEAEFISVEVPLLYTLHFENLPTAGAAAQEVWITDTLNPNLDWSTLELGQIGFNDVTIEMPALLQAFQTNVHVTTDPNPVQVRAVFDPGAGIVTWHLISLDPITGQLVDDPLAGFLPPNDPSRRGEGFVSFLIHPKAGLPSGTQITNQARIVFDVNPPIDTPIVTNTVDSMAPSSGVAPLPARTANSFLLQWFGQDGPGGSGLESLDIFASSDGTNYVLWLANTTATSAEFTGQPGRTYWFYSVGRDWVGNREAAPATADAATAIEILAPSLAIALEGTTVRLRWPSFSGVSYQVQVSETLTHWIDFGLPLLGTGGDLELQFAVSAASSQFFRLRAGD